MEFPKFFKVRSLETFESKYLDLVQRHTEQLLQVQLLGLVEVVL